MWNWSFSSVKLRLRIYILACWQKFLSSGSWAHKFNRERVNSEPAQGPLISLNNSLFLSAGLFFVGLVPELPHCTATELFKSNTGNGILAEKKQKWRFPVPI